MNVCVGSHTDLLTDPNACLPPEIRTRGQFHNLGLRRKLRKLKIGMTLPIFGLENESFRLKAKQAQTWLNNHKTITE